MLPVKTNVLWGMLLSSLVVSVTHTTENLPKNDHTPEKKAILVAAAAEQALQNRAGVKELTPAEEAFLQEAKKFLDEVEKVSAEVLVDFRKKAVALLQNEPAYQNACAAAKAVSNLKPSFGLAKELDKILKMMPQYMQERLQRAFKDLGFRRMLQLSKPFLWSKKEKVEESVLHNLSAAGLDLKGLKEPTTK